MPHLIDKPFAERAAGEIDALHRLLQAWFRAEGEPDPAPIIAHFDERYRMVGAAGNVVTYEQTVANLPKIRGARPTLIMEISDVVVHHLEGASALVTYRERQREDSGSTERWSAALLIDRADRPTPVWLHLQETFSK